jgi:uncharacterized tellurite resistance protein B-like protein
MSFWQKFSNSNEDKRSSLEKILEKEFPDFSQDRLTKLASISGLLSVVAFADLVIEESEVVAIKTSLEQWSTLDTQECDAISKIAQEHAKELIDLENHLYANSLNELLNRDEKYYLIESLFEVAASDGAISNVESEQIRSITKSLRLEANLFLAARAKYSDKLDILKS